MEFMNTAAAASTAAFHEMLVRLTLNDLRTLIAEAGLSTDGCLDKTDLCDRAEEALERLMLPGAHLGPVSRPIVENLLGPDELAETRAAAREEAMRVRAEKAAAAAEKQAAAKSAHEEELQSKTRSKDEVRHVEAEAEAAQLAEEADMAEMAKFEAQRATQQVVNLAAQLVGTDARIVGLRSRPECNGLVGRVLSSTDKGRCVVQVEVHGLLEVMSLRPVNLEED